MSSRQRRQRQLAMLGTQREGLTIAQHLRDHRVRRYMQGVPAALGAAVMQLELRVARALARDRAQRHVVEGERSAFGCRGARHLHGEPLSGPRVELEDPDSCLFLRCDCGRTAEVGMPGGCDLETPALAVRAVASRCEYDLIGTWQ